MFSSPYGHAALIYRLGPFRALRIHMPPVDKPSPLDRNAGEEWAHPAFHPPARELTSGIVSYFSGTPLPTPWELMDISDFSEFEQATLRAVADVPYGALSTYKAIAQAVGKPDAYRAVGTALSKNPYPILIPCHRIIKSDGDFGSFGGDEYLKQRLIEAEAAFVEEGKAPKPYL